MSSTVENAPDTNGVRQKMLDTLKKELGSDLLESALQNDDLWVRVKNSAWARAVEVCRNDLDCKYFCFLAGIDWMPNPGLSGEKTFGALEGEDSEVSTELKTGVAGGDTRFQVFARVYSIDSKVGITLKADVDPDNPVVPSITALYAGADWHERETWEMYGFDFSGHPGLRHLYLPGEFEGYPLRKDFPLLARELKPWPGLVDVEAIPGEATSDSEGES